MQELVKGLVREIYEEVKVIFMVNEYIVQDYMELREKRMILEGYSMSNGMRIFRMLGKMKRD